MYSIQEIAKKCSIGDIVHNNGWASYVDAKVYEVTEEGVKLKGDHFQHEGEKTDFYFCDFKNHPDEWKKWSIRPNPNARKYFEPKYGMTYNNKCPECDTPTFQPENVHTMSEGHAYFKNELDDNGDGIIVGVIRGVIDKSVKKGIYCGPCDLKLFPVKRGHNNGKQPN